MTQNNNYSYNSCTSKGACSTNPRTSSLQEILILYLKLSAYYALFLEENNIHNKKIKNLILNTISVMITNPEFSESDFLSITKAFETEIPLLIKEYKVKCKKDGINPKPCSSVINYNKKADIVTSIKLGEKEFLKKARSIPQKISNLYKIMFIIAKSICINILNLQTYNIDEKEGYITILKLLNLLNEEKNDIEKLKDFIIETSKLNVKLMKHIRKIQIEMYGEQSAKNVSYSTAKGKAILVVGENIRELELLLESVKNTDIDVYTHDKMILAHTFPKFSEYENLKGQYGQGVDNYLPDFVTFPGPIVLTRHSLYNVENLYRGQLFTTDIASTQGVIRINNFDFSTVIETANHSKGFKTGKTCNEEVIGYNFNRIKKEILTKLSTNNYSKIFILGNNNYNGEISEYFDTIIKKSSKDILLISLAPRNGRDDMISYNACFDIYAIIRIIDYLKNITKVPITVYIPECRRHTISTLIYFKNIHNIEIFVGKCNPASFNPALMETLKETFQINIISNPEIN